MVSDATIGAFAHEMLSVFRDHRLVRETDTPIDRLTLDAAYQVQERVIAARVASGEHHIGYKVGCTSRAIQQQFSLSEPINAHLMAPHVHDDGARLKLVDYMDPAVEPELVLRIGQDLSGEGLPDEVLRDAIIGISAGIEVHNYRFVYGAPTSQELVASNGIHAAQVVHSDARPMGDIDLALEGFGIWVGGKLCESAIGAEILGIGPLESLRWLVGHLTRRGRRLERGQLVIPGSPVGLMRVGDGDQVVARFTHFGSCRVTFGKGT